MSITGVLGVKGVLRVKEVRGVKVKEKGSKETPAPGDQPA